MWDALLQQPDDGVRDVPGVELMLPDEPDNYGAISAFRLAGMNTAAKAKQAQAKLTQIQRLEKERRSAKQELEALTARRRSLGFEFLKPARSGRIVLEATDEDADASEPGSEGRSKADSAKSGHGKPDKAGKPSGAGMRP